MRIIYVVVLGLLVGASAQAAAGQKLKFPSLLPFKKQNSGVRPYALTDEASFAGSEAQVPTTKFRLFVTPMQSPTFVDTLGQRSKDFWYSAGQNLSKVANDTRGLFRLSSDNPILSLGDSLTWPGWPVGDKDPPPLRPSAHMARDWSVKPKHRF